MANSILKLNVETSEYDAKLKKAAEGIRHLAEVAHRGGGELTGLEQAELDFIRALGDMETKSRTAAGSTRELENAFKELTVIYNGLSEVEKADEGGKALAASLETIKQRANDAKSQLDAASKSLHDNESAGQQSSSMLEQLGSKFTVNIDAIKLFNIGLQAAEGALQVAKDAFFNNDEQLDEWGRTVQASESLYEGFLNALNTSDISGYLTNIGNIINAAREAYDALDALGTYNAFNQINVEKTRTNMNQSIADFRGGQGSKDAVKAAGEAYKNELKDRQRLENEAYIAAVKDMAAKRGANAKDLMDALSGTYGHYQDLKNVQPTGTATKYVPGLPGMPGRYEEYKVAQNNQERLGEALRHLNDTELQSLQALGAQAQRTGNEIAQVDRQLVRTLNAKEPGTGTSGKSGSKTPQTKLQQNQKKINDLTQEYVKLGDIETEASRQRQTEIQKEIELLKQRNGLLSLRAAQAQGRFLVGAGDFQKEGLKNVSGVGMLESATNNGKSIAVPTGGLQLSDKAMGAVNKNIQKQMKGVESIADKWQDVGSAISAVGSAMTSIEDPAVKVLGIVAQAIATVALTFAKSLSGTVTPWDWIAAAAAGTATMISTISAIHSATGYANGGIVGRAEGGFVPGSAFSSDVTPIMANAGELVLSRSQQSNLASQLQGSNIPNLNLTAIVRGEQIRLALNNNGRRTGRGEYVQSKNVK